MIVLDSSALIAVLLDEPERQAFSAIIAGEQRCVISAVNAHETAIVLRLRHGPAPVERLWQLLADCDIEIHPFDAAQLRAAAIAFDQFGKGINPRSRLNLSDCAAYALAKTMNAPLLFKGDDFAATDLQRARSAPRQPGLRRSPSTSSAAAIARANAPCSAFAASSVSSTATRAAGPIVAFTKSIVIASSSSAWCGWSYETTEWVSRNQPPAPLPAPSAPAISTIEVHISRYAARCFRKKENTFCQPSSACSILYIGRS